MRLVTLMATFLAACVAAGGAAAASDVSGHWTVTITAADNTITGRATLKQAGNDVTGVIGPAEDATIPVEGTRRGDTVTLKLKPQPGRTAAFDTCTLTIAGDKMTGTIEGGDVGKGRIAFVRSPT
jgi:hypothetical protein